MTPILDPRCPDDVRFVLMDGEHATYRVPLIPRRRSLIAPPIYEQVQYFVCDVRPYHSDALGRVRAGCADADRARLLVALRAAESVILFFAWLCRNAA